MNIREKLPLNIITIVLFSCSSQAFTNTNLVDCGQIEKEDARMLWDYTDPTIRRPTGAAPNGRLNLVERRHFTSEVEALKRGKTSVDPLDDIIYTLTRIPNHHRALWAFSRYVRQPGNAKKIATRNRLSGKWPRNAECVFERAIEFNPNDPITRMIFGMHYQMLGEYDKADQLYKIAGELGLKSGEYYYNYGLLKFSMGDYSTAKQYSAEAKKKGYLLKGLERKLKKIYKEENNNRP